VFLDVVYGYSTGMCCGAADLTCGFLIITIPSIPQALSSVTIGKLTSKPSFVSLDSSYNSRIPRPPERPPGLNVYGAAAPNPVKLTIMAEEPRITDVYPLTSIPYNLINMNLAEMKEPWHEAINPNGRVPAIVHVKEDGTSETIFESGACLLYLVHEFDKAHQFHDPVGTSAYWKQLSWVSLWEKRYGPMMGQAVHFHRYTPEPVPYGALASISPFVAGDRPTIADFAVFIYAHSAKWCGVDISNYLHVQTWREKLAQRPAVQRGLQVPTPYMISDDAVVDPARQDTLQMVRRYVTQVIKAASDQWPGEVVSTFRPCQLCGWRGCPVGCDLQSSRGAEGSESVSEERA
ncbi:glutathione S-transferase, partial [Apiospora phragmitis]